MMMVLVHFSTGFYAELKSWLILLCVTEISYLLVHGLKRASSVILMFPIYYGELLLSFKRRAQKFGKAPLWAFLCTNMSLIYHVALWNTLINRLCILGTPIDPLADAYLLHPPLWPPRPDNIHLDTESHMAIRPNVSDLTQQLCSTGGGWRALCQERVCFCKCNAWHIQYIYIIGKFMKGF